MHKNFDDHWSLFSDESVSQKKIRDASGFLAPAIDDYRGKKIAVLDAGCGNCVHAGALKNGIFDKDSIFVGLDISIIGMLTAQRRIPDWFLVNGDILRAPFVGNSFDMVFSFGVLGYTDNPRRSFDELCRVTKKGGMVGIWLYPHKKGLSGRLFSITRALARSMGPSGAGMIANIIVPFLIVLPTRSKMNLFNATWKQCREVVMVNIEPEKLLFFERDEIIRWYKENNIEIVVEDRSNPITIWGRKS